MSDIPNDWQLNCKKFVERGTFILEHRQWTDCTFSVGDGLTIIQAHRLILAMASPVFELMFYGSMPESDKAIRIPDMKSEVFETMIEYIYDKKIEIKNYKQPYELAKGLGYAAKKYMLPHLLAISIEYLKTCVNAENACEIYEFAKLYEQPELMGKCTEEFCKHTSKILSEKVIRNMHPETLADIFEQPNLNITSELDLVRAAELYFTKEDQPPSLASMESYSDQSQLRNVIRKIRFLTLTPKQFCKGPALSQILEKSDSLSIVTKLILQKDDLPMPEGFTHSNIERNPILRCTRIFMNETQWRYSGNTKPYTVSFKTDTNITLLGLQIPTQKGDLGQMYSEHIKACVGLKSNFVILAECELIYSSHFNITQDLIFDTPCSIEKDKVYDIRIQFNKFGSYPVGTGSYNLEEHQINFHFPNPENRGDSLTRSIIFKMDKS